MPFNKHIQYQQTANPGSPIIPELPSWHQAFFEPVRRVATVAVIATSGLFATPFTPSETTTVDKWFSLFSEPIRQKQGLQAQHQQFLAIDPFILTQSERIDESKWHQPWSEPVRQRLGLRTDLQQSIAPDPYPRPPEAMAVGSWYVSLSEPVRQKLGLRASLQQFFTIDPFILTQPEQVSEDKWHQPWSVPTRRKVRTASSAEITPPVAIAPLTLPSTTVITTVQYNRKTYYQTIAAPVFTPAEQINEDKWHRPWSEPVRLKQGLGAWLQYVTDINPLPRPPDQTTAANWYIPLSEPVRLKPGLRISLQQFLAIDPFILTQPEQVSEDKWHQPWSEPIRLPKGLGAWLQAFRAATDIPTGIIPNVTVIISATETNNDSFYGGILVFASLPANHALVSIIEIPVPGNDPSSIVES